MATDPGLGKTAAKAALDAIVDSLDAGTAATVPKLRIYSGTQPASPDTAVPTGATLLAEMNLGGATAFGAATTGTGGNANHVIANMTTATASDTSANATGTAAWFRAVDQDNAAIIDGSVGTSNADLTLNNTSITAAQTVQVTDWTVRLQYKN